ncbi:GNAT family N-acetyltransferase [Haloplasma contractile]|uniref:N-acetyltransferase GCN5 protein n=1 Tax=Haloplasma contractile SSD-17B TaxID=1033810 RepID=U2E6S8_9MOLU|nr:GNAT family N-acetyltransferase [Haloplasma contractile]ERJ10923.1 N-acetyltransferase GCN5 protein [Haloplasma contractile SSD-17B]
MYDIHKVKKKDKPTWIRLSSEYDDYVRELVPDLTEWYEGNETDISYDKYMNAKIEKGEAFMVKDKKTNKCLGIVAFSKKNNRITYLAVSHQADFFPVGELLMKLALSQLSTENEIAINVIKSKAEHIKKEKELITSHGFKSSSCTLENGVPVLKMILFATT